ncbi:inner membrane protein YbjM [Scandinavium sp. H11S7]|uniref:inner membrane protein YbjM n=1 Tax=Scandinavium hiltneri TaxID=2926519 RepID=UPI002165FC16|nr:inner membrane protein YbjM [Scandinavium hiltneri]MCS2158399.1 inner membrane protein YbjM [Scandinavium hiltneri]
MRSERGWAGVICCFVLFIVVCLFLLLNMKGAFRASGHPELGLLFFVVPGAVASFMSSQQRVLLPLLGAILATPVCLIVMRVWIFSDRSFWQELAWMCSAVFWCALGALCFLFISGLFVARRGRQ